MRSLLMLLLVVLAFLALRWFAPGQANAADEAPPTTEAGAHFLASPEPEPTVSAARTEPRATSLSAATPEPPKTPESWPANLLSSSASGTPDELRIAAALVHGTPAEVQQAAGSLAPDRALLLESFAWALAGERQMALSLSEKIAAKEAIATEERTLFEAALTGRAGKSADAKGPVPLAMEMALTARDAACALTERSFPAAARGYSELLAAELGAPWPADRATLARWTKGLDEAQREHRWNPRSEWPSIELKVERGDSLIAIRMRYLADHAGARMCTGLIERANRLKGQLQPGQILRIPTDPARIQVDLDARWALFFLGDEVAAAWPVGIGRPGEETPPGDYTVRNKIENPPWMKEGQEPVPFGDPKNPLGTRWIGWSKDAAKTSYGFHGTWSPESIGQAASDGCVRFLNEDVEELFQILPEGAPIRIQG
jgi:hypothetical protein